LETQLSHVPDIADSRQHPLTAYFEQWRRRRAERYAERTPRDDRRRAVLTIVRNEAVLFPIWLRYYSKFFAPDDIYVLDHRTSDGSTERPGFVRVPVDHDKVYDSGWLTDVVQAHQHALFERYEVVLTVDSDEIVAPDPAWGTLGDYIDRFDEEFVNCVGYEVLHLRDREPPLRLGEPVLAQRDYWYAHGAYDKPALASAPSAWARCFHTLADGRQNYDPDLRLIHLHRMDFGISLARHRRHGDEQWNEQDVVEGWGYHNLLTDEVAFEQWFYGDTCFEEVPMALERIPAAWKGVV
jgi:hypothetical protein